jgi:hypothetical protein
MTNLVEAFQQNNIREFEKILKNNRCVMWPRSSLQAAARARWQPSTLTHCPCRIFMCSADVCGTGLAGLWVDKVLVHGRCVLHSHSHSHSHSSASAAPGAPGGWACARRGPMLCCCRCCWRVAGAPSWTTPSSRSTSRTCSTTYARRQVARRGWASAAADAPPAAAAESLCACSSSPLAQKPAPLFAAGTRPSIFSPADHHLHAG